jgi:putative oxidoreductase
MRLIPHSSARQTDIGLLVLRVIIGTIFVAHGGQKLFVFGLDGVAGGFAQMGVPMAGLVGPLVGFVEFFGGLALITGLLTRLAGVGLAVVMTGAMMLVHLPNGFFAPNGIEFTLALFGSAVALVLTGAGRFSLDALVTSRSGAPAAASAPEAVKVRRVA